MEAVDVGDEDACDPPLVSQLGPARDSTLAVLLLGVVLGDPVPVCK